MSDTVQDPNPYRLPFTRAEYVAAQAQLRPRAEAEELAARLFDPDPHLIGITVMDGDYLLLALVSEDLARRVAAVRPRLADLIRQARANRDDFLRQWRESIARGEQQ